MWLFSAWAMARNVSLIAIENQILLGRQRKQPGFDLNQRHELDPRDMAQLIFRLLAHINQQVIFFFVIFLIRIIFFSHQCLKF